MSPRCDVLVNKYEFIGCSLRYRWVGLKLVEFTENEKFNRVSNLRRP